MFVTVCINSHVFGYKIIYLSKELLMIINFHDDLICIFSVSVITLVTTSWHAVLQTLFFVQQLKNSPI